MDNEEDGEDWVVELETKIERAVLLSDARSRITEIIKEAYKDLGEELFHLACQELGLLKKFNKPTGTLTLEVVPEGSMARYARYFPIDIALVPDRRKSVMRFTE